MKILVSIIIFTRAGQYEQKRMRAHTKLFRLKSDDSSPKFIFRENLILVARYSPSIRQEVRRNKRCHNKCQTAILYIFCNYFDIPAITLLLNSDVIAICNYFLVICPLVSAYDFPNQFFRLW